MVRDHHAASASFPLGTRAARQIIRFPRPVASPLLTASRLCSSESTDQSLVGRLIAGKQTCSGPGRIDVIDPKRPRANCMLGFGTHPTSGASGDRRHRVIAFGGGAREPSDMLLPSKAGARSRSEEPSFAICCVERIQVPRPMPLHDASTVVRFRAAHRGLSPASGRRHPHSRACRSPRRTLAENINQLACALRRQEWE
jgi:hypothetical protein